MITFEEAKELAASYCNEYPLIPTLQTTNYYVFVPSVPICNSSSIVVSKNTGTASKKHFTELDDEVIIEEYV